MSKRYVTRHVLPTPYEREILTILQEECAEIIVAVSKALRFGLEDGYPGGTETNRQAIGREIGDLDVLIDLAKQNGLFLGTDRIASHANKRKSLVKFMQHRPEDH